MAPYVNVIDMCLCSGLAQAKLGYYYTHVSVIDHYWGFEEIQFEAAAPTSE
jgi:hypothetical protein